MINTTLGGLEVAAEVKLVPMTETAPRLTADAQRRRTVIELTMMRFCKRRSQTQTNRRFAMNRGLWFCVSKMLQLAFSNVLRPMLQVLPQVWMWTSKPTLSVDKQEETAFKSSGNVEIPYSRNNGILSKIQKDVAVLIGFRKLANRSLIPFLGALC